MRKRMFANVLNDTHLLSLVKKDDKIFILEDDEIIGLIMFNGTEYELYSYSFGGDLVLDTIDSDREYIVGTIRSWF